MNERLDKQLLQLNKKYQDLLCRPSKEKSWHFYCMKLKEGDIPGIIEQLQYNAHAKRCFSQKGNSIVSTSGKLSVEGKRIAVYSCIVGPYDQIIEPVNVEEELDYLMFTDQEIPESSSWIKIDVTTIPEYQSLSPLKLNRMIKFLPERFLKEYDYSIYVDGNIEIVTGMFGLVSEMGNCSFGVHYHGRRDCIYDEKTAIKHYKKADLNLVLEQLKTYKKEGYPAHNGLFENSVLIRDHHDELVAELMERWWKEFLKYPTRDQLSLPYLMWKMSFPKDKLFVMGHNIDRNPRFNRVVHPGNT